MALSDKKSYIPEGPEGEYMGAEVFYLEDVKEAVNECLEDLDNDFLNGLSAKYYFIVMNTINNKFKKHFGEEMIE